MKFLIILSLILVLLTGCTNSSNTNQDNSNITESQSMPSNTFATRTTTTPKVEKEEELASFSTPILIKESGRQNNVSITCSKLNGTIVNPGAIFSFTATVGKADPSQGYQKADIFDANGKIIKGYGGGNCQVSSTLYNAVLAVPTLVVTERHEHSREVDYVEDDKDAAVAYGSVDFKFRNDNPFPIKIYATTDGETMTTKIVKIINQF